jgi:hypothetical protein
MKFKAATWIMLATLVAIAAYFFLVDEKGRKTREREHLSGRKLFSYTRAEVERFVLINPQGERIEAARNGSDWRIVSPVEAPGDQPEIASFLDQVVPGRGAAKRSASLAQRRCSHTHTSSRRTQWAW